MFLCFSAGRSRWFMDWNRSDRWERTSVKVCVGCIHVCDIKMLRVQHLSDLLSQLQQPRLFRLKSPHLLQDRLLLLFAHKPWVRPPAVSRILRVSKQLSNNPLRSVDATVTETEFGYCEGILQLLCGFVLTCLVQIVYFHAGSWVQVSNARDAACASDRECWDKPVALTCECAELGRRIGS